eukprot:jgi/Ulvmu1/6789/UM030_0127.1
MKPAVCTCVLRRDAVLAKFCWRAQVPVWRATQNLLSKRVEHRSRETSRHNKPTTILWAGFLTDEGTLVGTGLRLLSCADAQLINIAAAHAHAVRCSREVQGHEAWIPHAAIMPR